jgi:hypothetical protein
MSLRHIILIPDLTTYRTHRFVIRFKFWATKMTKNTNKEKSHLQIFEIPDLRAGGMVPDLQFNVKTNLREGSRNR